MTMHMIPTALLQELHDYLLGRPMREVEGMVAAIRQCPMAQAVNARDEALPDPTRQKMETGNNDTVAAESATPNVMPGGN